MKRNYFIFMEQLRIIQVNNILMELFLYWFGRPHPIMTLILCAECRSCRMLADFVNAFTVTMSLCQSTNSRIYENYCCMTKPIRLFLIEMKKFYLNPRSKFSEASIFKQTTCCQLSNSLGGFTHEQTNQYSARAAKST